MVAIIKDTPDRILEAEHEKPSAIARAEEKIFKIKTEKNAEDFDDTKRQREPSMEKVSKNIAERM